MSGLRVPEEQASPPEPERLDSPWSGGARIVGPVILVLTLPLSAVLHAAVEFVVCAVALALSLTLGALLVLVDAGARLAGRRRPAAAPESPPDTSSISVLVLPRSGGAGLGPMLALLRDELREQGGAHQVIVVDDGADPATRTLLARLGPEVERVAPGGTPTPVALVQAGVARATGDVLLMIDGERSLQSGFLAPLLAGFDRADVFSVSPEPCGLDARLAGGQSSGRHRNFRRGRLRHAAISTEDVCAGYASMLWDGSGAAAFDRRMLAALGGLDTLYDSLSLANLDLGYRAWKRGWRVRSTPWVPRPHKLPELLTPRVLRDRRRDHYLFHWSNVVDPLATFDHFLWLASLMLEHARQAAGPDRHPLAAEVRALASSLVRLPAVLRRRVSSRRTQELDDREVWRRANGVSARATRPAVAAGEHVRLHVLVLSARLPRLNTDGSWILFNRLRELSRRHDVTLFAFVDDDDEQDAWERSAQQLREFCKSVYTHRRRVTHHKANLHHRVPYRLAREYSDYSMRDAVLAVLAATEFDLVQVEYSEMAHMMYRDLTDLKVVYTEHEPLNLYHERLFRGARGPGRLLHGFRWAQSVEHELRMLTAFDRVITLSDVDERNLRSYLPNLPVSTIPSGVNADRFWPLPDLEQASVVTFVGYFHHGPNVDGARWLAREVFPLVLRDMPAARLRIIGRDPMGAMDGLDSQAGVELTGYVEDLRPFMAESAVMTVPIRLGGGLRGKVLEAWAAGRAVVSTARGAEGFPVEEGVNALIADSAVDFARAIVRCLSDADLRRRLEQGGRRVVLERFTAEAGARRYEELYRDLLSESDTPGPAPAWDTEGLHARAG